MTAIGPCDLSAVLKTGGTYRDDNWATLYIVIVKVRAMDEWQYVANLAYWLPAPRQQQLHPIPLTLETTFSGGTAPTV